MKKFLDAKIKLLAEVQSRIHLCHNAVLFQLTGGLGKLYNRYEDNSHHSVFWTFCGDKELSYASFDCPTCAATLWAGYGEKVMSIEDGLEIENKLNSPYKDLQKSIDDMTPLLGLLDDGLYLAADYDLFPSTNLRSNDFTYGSFFMNHERANVNNQVHSYYYWDCYGHVCPAFLWSSENPDNIKEERVEYYVDLLQKCDEKSIPRAVAFYVNGAIALLLDGHHKAVAAAQLGRKVKCIVLFRVEIEKEKYSFSDLENLFFYAAEYTENEFGSHTGPGPYLADNSGKLIGYVKSLKEHKAPAESAVKKGCVGPKWGFLPENLMPLYDKYPRENDIYRILAMNPEHIFDNFMKVYNCNLPVREYGDELFFDFDLLINLIWLRKICPETPYLKHWQKDWLDEFIQAGYWDGMCDSINVILNLLSELRLKNKPNPSEAKDDVFNGIRWYNQDLYRHLLNSKTISVWFRQLQKKHKELQQAAAKKGSS